MFCIFLIIPSMEEGSKLAQESSADVMAGGRASGKAWKIMIPSPGKGSAICHKLVSACCVHVQRRWSLSHTIYSWAITFSLFNTIEEKIHCVVVGASEIQLPFFFKMSFNALWNQGLVLWVHPDEPGVNIPGWLMAVTMAMDLQAPTPTHSYKPGGCLCI